MSSTTKKARISEESKELIESFQTTTDLYKSLDDYMRDSNKTTQKAKERLANEIADMGEKFIDEIEQKEIARDNEKQEKITFIARKTGDLHGSKEKLYSMSYEDVDSIYIKVKESKKNWFRQIIDFLMSW